MKAASYADFWGFIPNLVTASQLIDAGSTFYDRHLIAPSGNLQRLFHAENTSMSRRNADTRF